MKTRQELELVVNESSKLRLERLRLVYETLDRWCDHKLSGSPDPSKSTLLLGAYIDACQFFSGSHSGARKAQFDLHAFIGSPYCNSLA
jgi:hypothetical protein